MADPKVNQGRFIMNVIFIRQVIIVGNMFEMTKQINLYHWITHLNIPITGKSIVTIEHLKSLTKRIKIS